MTTWILIGDACRARLYQVRARRRLELVREFEHPAGRVPGRDLASDRPGRVRQRGSASLRSAVEPNRAAHEIEVDRFAAELAHGLSVALGRNAFTRLVLAAPPHFLGRLRAQLSPQVARRVVASLPKDLTAREGRELAVALEDQVMAL